MIEVKEISLLIGQIVAIRNSVDKNKTARKAVNAAGIPIKEDATLPSYWEGYACAVQWLEQIKTHAQKGVFPEKLFEKQAPNQTEDEREYVRVNYKQNTLNVFKDLVDTYGRAYHENNWSMSFQKDDSQYVKDGRTLQQYLEKDFPVYGSLENFTFNVLPPQKLMDAMGVVVVMPYEIPVIEDGDKTVIDPNELVRPYSQFFHVTKVMHLSEDVAIIESDEKSLVQVNQKDVNEGLVYLIFDKQWIHKAIQVGEKNEYKFAIEEYFEHSLEVIPVKMVDGIATLMGKTLMQQSPFLYAVDILDEAVLDSTLLRGMKPTCAFPYRIMLGDPCEFQIKVEGELITCDGGYHHLANGSRLTCKECNGSGMKDRVSPHGTLLIKPQTGLKQGDQISPDKAMHYASPGAEMFNVLREEINNFFLQAYDALHLKNVNKKVQGAEDQTATEAAGHQKALIASISTHTRQMFDLFEWQIEMNGKMRYGSNFKMPEIKRPTNYDFILESELLSELNDAITSSQPPVVVQSKMFNYLQAMSFSDVRGQKVFQLISRADRLITMTQNDINTKLSRGLVSNWEVILHDSALVFVNELLMDDPFFLDKELKVQIVALTDYAKRRTLEIAPAPVRSSSPAPTDIINEIIGA